MPDGRSTGGACRWSGCRAVGRCRDGLNGERNSVLSVYAVDAAGRGLVAVWPAAVGHRASRVAEVPATVSDLRVGGLSAAMSRLSAALWDVYARPASAAGDEQER